MSRQFKRYLLLLVLLSFAPLLRELFFGIISHHHQPFATFGDLLHTLSEMLVMLLLGCLLVFLDLRFTRDKHKELRVTQVVAIETLASLAEYRDAETSQHLHRISVFVKILGEKLISYPSYYSQISSYDDFVQDLVHASVLHDIGKIAVSDSTLQKPGPLTDEEFENIKIHTTIGADILLSADQEFQRRIGHQSYLSLAQVVARSHHEKWDGSGYPEGLSGEEIPLGARIVALCDVYDAVTSDRVYKRAWSHEKALELIKANRGKHFDPVLTDIFLEEEHSFELVKKKYKNS